MFRLRRGTLLLQTLSACLAAEAFDETEFVTDKRGHELAIIMGWPFDHISTALETWPADGLTHIWALGKLAACALQERPFIQFDGDVLFFKRPSERFLAARLCAQSPDDPTYYASPDMRTGFEVLGMSRAGVTAYNCGVVGGSDVPLVRAYAWAGLDLAEKFRRHPLNGTTTSMLVEQWQLGVFSRRTGQPVQTLLPLRPTEDQARQVGYAHLSGSAKHDPALIARAEARLARDFPEMHHRFLAAWEFLARVWPPALIAQDSGCSSPYGHQN